MLLTEEEWTIGHLRDHLQYAVDLEFWTIPFYLSTMFSIVDRSCAAYQLIQSVVNQEMLHVQLAANISNAYGLSPTFGPPRYVGHKIPHLDFHLDKPDDPRPRFSPYSAEIGPLSPETINAMCLIEFPEWGHGQPDLHDNVKEYGSIGAFYDAVAYGASLLQPEVRGGVHQVDYFSAFYRDLPTLTISDGGAAGFSQVRMLISVIRAQGEGENIRQDLPYPFWNTADDSYADEDHFEKFMQIRGGALPATYPTKAPRTKSDQDNGLPGQLVASFNQLRAALATMFSGSGPSDVMAVMARVGAGIQACWKRGIVPRFS